PLSPSRDQMVNLFNAASRRESVRFSTVDTGDAMEIHQSLGDVPDRGAPRRLAEVAGISEYRGEWGGGVTFPRFGEGEAKTADEGSEKHEYDNISKGDATPKTIAA